MMKPDDYWFPKKRFGLGWGPPRNLQGWAFLIGWILLLMLGHRSLNGWPAVAFLPGMLALLAIVVYFRGEPPGRGNWRRRS